METLEVKPPNSTLTPDTAMNNNITRAPQSLPTSQRHITRFTYKFTNFQGWRVAISRQGITLARYFSDKQYGEAELAYEQAVAFRDTVLNELRNNPERTREILDFYRIKPRPVYPAGLKPCQQPTDTPEPEEQKVGACSMRSNKVLHGVLKNVCKRFQLDTASVLKLSLYLFALQYSEAQDIAENLPIPHAMHANAQIPGTDKYLQLIIEQLESRARQAGLPSFEEFSTGRSRRLNHGNDATPEPPPVYLPTQGCHMRSPRPSPPRHNQTISSTLSASPSTDSYPSAKQISSCSSMASPLEAPPLKPPHRK